MSKTRAHTTRATFFFKLNLVVILLNRCTGFFFNRALSAICCKHDLIFQTKMQTYHTEYGVSILYMYYFHNFVRDGILCYCTSTHCLCHAHFKSNSAGGWAVKFSHLPVYCSFSLLIDAKLLPYFHHVIF